MAEQSYNLKYTGKEIDNLLDKANDMNKSAQVPTGGSAGQALVKNSSTNYDVKWATIQSGGGTTGDSDILIVYVSGDSSSNYSADKSFEDVYEAVNNGKLVVMIFTGTNSATLNSSVARLSIASGTSHSDFSSSGGPDQYSISFSVPLHGNMYIQSYVYAPINYTVFWYKTIRSGTTSYSIGGNSTTCYQLPSGGTDGQVLTKDGTSNYKTKWANPPSGSGNSVSTSVIIDSSSTLLGSSSKTYTFDALNNGDRVIVMLRRESGRYTTNEYTWYGTAETKLMVCHPNDNQGSTIFGMAYLESTQITLAQTAWWSGYEYTGALSNTLVTGYKVIVARYS